MSAPAKVRRRVVWPAHRFYWAVLDASVVPGGLLHRRPSDEALGFLFEAELPVPIDRIHAVYVPVKGNRFIVCGIEHDRILESAELRDALTLSPEAFPSDLGTDLEVDVGSINFLTGRHEPAPVKRERRRLLLESAAALALITVAVAFGAERRIGAWHRATGEMVSAREVVFDDLYPPQSTAPSSQSPTLRLVAELRQLERTRGSAVQSIGSDDPQSAHMLARLFEQWPAQQPIMTESLSVTPESVTLVGLLPTAPAAQVFVSAFDLPDQWEARQPQISAVTNGVRLTWKLVPRLIPQEVADGGGS
ncbi:MAG: hypothetical protein IT430_17325 [Phycisphaerales bacterium]|nr:hypothetical protein [Phycisphaerales bacterium]